MRGFWQQPIVVAAYRAVAGGAIMAGGAYFGVLNGGGTQRMAGVAAGAAFFAFLAWRAGLEGLIDQHAAQP